MVVSRNGIARIVNTSSRSTEFPWILPVSNDRIDTVYPRKSDPESPIKMEAGW